MGKARGIVVLVLVVGGVIASFFIVGGADVAKWNDKAIAVHMRFGMDWKEFEASIVPWLQGNAIEGEKVEAAFKTYSRKIGQAAGEIRRALPPDDSHCKFLCLAADGTPAYREQTVGIELSW